VKAVVDTNVLLFDTFEDSEHHAEAASGLDSLDGWGLPDMVLHELVWFFRSQDVRIPRATAKVNEYLIHAKTMFIPCTTDDIRFACSKMKSYKEYNDLIILSAARRLDLPLFSFDEELKAAAKGISVKTVRTRPS
jgi:predicted nucleic acid-binding protein